MSLAARLTTLIPLLSLVLVASAQAQVTGRVADPQGAVIVGAQLTLTAPGQPTRTLQTGADGTFSLDGVPPGEYAVTVTSPGFVTATQNVTLPLASPLAVTLQVAGVSEGVIVSATTQLGLTVPESTGTRLDLPPLETPASVAVVSGDLIRNLGIPSLYIARSLAPGVTSSSPVGSGGNVLNARGFTGQNSVKSLFNGMEIYNAGGVVSFPFDPWNVERIGVLYGPASVLYGSGAIGGAVNVVPKRPNPNLRQHEVALSAGSFGSYHSALGSTGPINGWSSYRFDVSKYSSDHWVARGQSDSLAMSISLRFDASPKLRFVVSNDYGEQNPSTYLQTPVMNNAPVPGLRYQNYNVADAKFNFMDDWTNVETTWTISPSVSVSNNTYFMYHDRVYHDVFTFAYVPATNQVRRTQFRDINSTWETQYGNAGYLKQSGTIGGLKNEVLVGVDYNRNFYNRRDTVRGGTSLVNATNFNPGNYFDFYQAVAIPFYRMHVNQVAVFGEDHLSLTNSTAVVLGVRQDHYHVDRLDDITHVRTLSDHNGTGWNVGVVQDLATSLAVYAQYAEGSDPVNSFSSIAANQQGFNLSPGKQFEVGVKQSTWSNRIEWTFAAYRLVKEDLLTPAVSNPSLTEQVGQQSSRGVEASFSLGAGPFRVNVNGAKLNAKFDEFRAVIAGASVSLAGNVPLNVPEESANLIVFFNPIRAIELRSVMRYVGERFADNTNVPLSRIPSYRVVDFGGRWQVIPKLSLDLRVDNALDEIYADSGSATAWQLGAPRAVTLSANVKF
ncbi:MAG: TonB-dependent receptor [Vicinamibacterales bacterium]